MPQIIPFNITRPALAPYLRSVLKSVSLAVGLCLFSACATTPDPAEVCSAEWIKPRTERAVNELKRDTFSRLKTIASAASTYEVGEGLSLFQQWRAASAVKGLIRDYETSTALADLKILSATCKDPKIAKDAFYGMLEEAGFSEKLIAMFDSFQTLFPQTEPT